MSGKHVFVTGGTGYMGRALRPRLLARGHGLVPLSQMTAALVLAVESPPRGVRVVAVPEIRAAVL